MKIQIKKLDVSIYVFPTILFVHYYGKKLMSMSFLWLNFGIHITF